MNEKFISEPHLYSLFRHITKKSPDLSITGFDNLWKWLKAIRFVECRLNIKLSSHGFLTMDIEQLALGRHQFWFTWRSLKFSFIIYIFFYYLLFLILNKIKTVTFHILFLVFFCLWTKTVSALAEMQELNIIGIFF